MVTTQSDIYDLFMQLITDYRLIDLYRQSQTDFETYLQAWLIFSINEFSSVCSQELDFDSSTGEFSVLLTTENKTILARIMVKYWLQKTVSDVTQMNLHIKDRDFDVYSEAQNLKAKQDYLMTVKEEISLILNNYAYTRNSWSDWFAQNFAGG